MQEPGLQVSVGGDGPRAEEAGAGGHRAGGGGERGARGHCV